MQFVSGGPDIPETLLDAHEDGRVVFFCGAGISFPAGLPGFRELVDKIYEHIGTQANAIELEAYSRNQFDATLDLLERRLGTRTEVRSAVASILKPQLRRKGATNNHAALLTLARNRIGDLRLITTNFDRIFEHVAKRSKKPHAAFPAPMLPVPKNSRWDGLVYLHGLLPEQTDQSSLQKLVLTSGDFGLAYLTERWAARFVSELFRSYVVCFVGYSINDPVLRYMMDALAADRMLGEKTPRAFAFGEFRVGEEKAKTTEWEAKGVIPILYENRSNSHVALYDTIKIWSETYRDGILGREQIVVDYALARPSASTIQDNFVGRMLWALSHDSGLPAKRFADFSPVPSLDWLDALSQNCFHYYDLARFGVSPRAEHDKLLRFSILRRPTPYALAQWMVLASPNTHSSQWDKVMLHLARWLTRHLNDPKLIIWIAQAGGQLHESLITSIEDELERLHHLEISGKWDELRSIRASAPNAVPTSLMRTLWRLLLTGCVGPSGDGWRLYHWKRRLNRDGLTATLRLQLKGLLAPKVNLREPFRWNSDNQDLEEPTRIRQLVDWDLVLATEHVHSAVRDLNDTNWQNALPRLLLDFQDLLRSALDLLWELGDTDGQTDRSFWDMPSISPHWQNKEFRDWVALISLLRDAWCATFANDCALASTIAQQWFALPYATFKRLALFAASQDGCIAPEQWTSWLLSDGAWWLWSTATQRETMRLLVLQSAKAPLGSSSQLEAVILRGPPRTMFRDDIETGDWDTIVAHSVWLRLSKLVQGGCELGIDAANALSSIEADHPEWELNRHEREEFPHWMSGTGDPDYQDEQFVDNAPRRRKEIVDWLKKPREERASFLWSDNWRDICKTHFLNAGCALFDLLDEGIWPEDRWNDAFGAWSRGRLAQKSWKYFAPFLEAAPTILLQKTARAIAWWLESISESAVDNETAFLFFCGRVLNFCYDDPVETDQPVSRAINHPVGLVTQAIINVWFRSEPNDNDLLSGNVRLLFTSICNVGTLHLRHGRVLLSSRLIAFFRVDREWTRDYLLPLFNWEHNREEARSAWEGFLWSPRLFNPLLTAFRESFLDTANHYEELGEHKRQFAAILTYAALNPADGFTPNDFQRAIGCLPQEGLEEVAQALVQALESSGEQRMEYWKNRIVPFWHHIWPKALDLGSSQIAESLARLAIEARESFPAALQLMEEWLRAADHLDHIVHLLKISGLVQSFPSESLRFLGRLLNDQQWAPPELRECLSAIARIKPALVREPQYRRIDEFLRRNDG